MSYRSENVAVGEDDSQVKKQFRINPRLQRTQATGNRQGKTLTTIEENVIQDGIVRLPNRAVPLNAKTKPKRRAGRQPR